jgi:hypothetical protein
MRGNASVQVSPGATPVTLRIPPLRARPAPQPLARIAPDQGSTLRNAGIVGGAVGLASLLASAGLGLYAKNEGDRSKRDALCPTDDHDGCTPEGVTVRSRARAFGTASTVTFVAGAALLTAGVVLWSTAPRKPERPSQARWELRAAGSSESFATAVRGSW